MAMSKHWTKFESPPHHSSFHKETQKLVRTKPQQEQVRVLRFAGKQEIIRFQVSHLRAVWQTKRITDYTIVKKDLLRLLSCWMKKNCARAAKQWMASAGDHDTRPTKQEPNLPRNKQVSPAGASCRVESFGQNTSSRFSGSCPSFLSPARSGYWRRSVVHWKLRWDKNRSDVSQAFFCNSSKHTKSHKEQGTAVFFSQAPVGWWFLAYDSIQTSSIQNVALHVGQGLRLDIHVSGADWSCRLAYHLPMHSRHHIGRQ